MSKFDRAFGVEIEMGFPSSGGEGSYYCDGCDDYHYDEEDELEEVRSLLQNNGFEITDWANSGWSFCYDGSGVEARTPILRGAEGFDELERAVKLFVDNGAYVDRPDGLHVHIDAPEFVGNSELILKLVRSWRSNHPFISCYHSPARLNNVYCPDDWGDNHWLPLLENHVEKVKKGEADPHDFYKPGRGALNTNAIEDHGSVEFRCHEGTLDIEKIKAWVTFCQGFIEGVLERKNPMQAATSPANFLQRLSLPAAVIDTLERSREAYATS